MALCAHCRAEVQPGAKSCWQCGVTLSGVDQQTQPGAGAWMGTPVDDPMIGRSIIDQYVVRAKLGEGGMGAVYLADQPSVGRSAVIKVIHPWYSRDPAIAARFATEARAAARLQNPHIVGIYNHGKMADGTLFLAMEHIRGYTLAQLVAKDGRLEPARAVAIATQCCEALSEAHRRGVVHRDLKPSNIMLVPRAQGPEFVKVLDFGVAKLDGGEGSVPGAMPGTPQFMSPEQLAGRPVDGRSDVYTLGLCVYTMLAGRPPFVADNAVGYVHQHLSEHPPALGETCPGVRVPPALEACVLRALAKSAHQRPQSADMFADELWSALMATVEISHVRIPIPKAPPPPRAAVVSAIATALVLVSAAVTVGAWVLFDRGGEPDATQQQPPSPTADVADADPAPRAGDPAAKNPERDALMTKSIPELEAELQRVTILSGLRRDAIELSLQDYRDAVENPPADVDPNAYRKALLADLILVWRAQKVQQPPLDRSLDELEAVFLTMQSSYDVETRRQMLHQLKNGQAEDTEVRGTLLRWIDEYASLPRPDDVVIVEEDP